MEQNHERDDPKRHYLQEAVDVLFQLADVTIALEGDSNVEHRSCSWTAAALVMSVISSGFISRAAASNRGSQLGKHRRVDEGFFRATIAGFFDECVDGTTSPADRGEPGRERDEQEKGTGSALEDTPTLELPTNHSVRFA